MVQEKYIEHGKGNLCSTWWISICLQWQPMRPLNPADCIWVIDRLRRCHLLYRAPAPTNECTVPWANIILCYHHNRTAHYLRSFVAEKTESSSLMERQRDDSLVPLLSSALPQNASYPAGFHKRRESRIWEHSPHSASVSWTHWARPNQSAPQTLQILF